ncbi:MAG: flagellar biosynthesis regulator FlaF [Devosia marina]|jgi:flagellar protein FlaF|uniref:Flagellar biosynthesis regulator FlaF n=1 Tax=Devosia marina TaxID=2683198 RepID=A0A7X3FPY4_9HYPH|nr:flagellar biosynthesis regulator FlaF [Devosia marina]MVS98619.1 flagellar biosynthesis regulator FlaF [Devosia marina]
MHQHGAQAYQQTAKVVENPRQRESALLMKAAAGLQKVKDEWDISTTEELRSALTFNRKLWTIFMSAVTQDDSPLPPEIRQNIANLGMFVMNQTREILYEGVPEAEQLTVLVQLNRQIAAGLRGM